MKYSPNTLEFSHILNKSFKPCPCTTSKIHSFTNKVARHILTSLYLTTCHLTLKFDEKYALACPSAIKIGRVICYAITSMFNQHTFVSNKITIPNTVLSPVSQPFTQKLGQRCISKKAASCPLNQQIKHSLHPLKPSCSRNPQGPHATKTIKHQTIT